jgi:hypothetical protein
MVRDPSSVGDWLPDQFAYVDHEVRDLPVRIARRAHLPGHTHKPGQSRVRCRRQRP